MEQNKPSLSKIKLYAEVSFTAPTDADANGEEQIFSDEEFNTEMLVASRGEPPVAGGLIEQSTTCSGQVSDTRGWIGRREISISMLLLFMCFRFEKSGWSIVYGIFFHWSP
jgi:hypothetical protein